MSLKRYSGKWNGQYTYGQGYSARLQGKSAPFTLVIDVQGNGNLTGHCIDDGYETKVDTRAVVEGCINSSGIEFVKKYRHHWRTNEDGSVGENRDRESHEVNYSGRATMEGVFAGEWKIFTSVVRSDGSIGEFEVGGFWIMHKEA